MTFVPDAVSRFQDLGAAFQQLANLNGPEQSSNAAALSGATTSGSAQNGLGSYSDFASLLGQIEQQLYPSEASASTSGPTAAQAGAATSTAPVVNAATGSLTNPAGLGSKVVSDAEKYLGVPYAWGGTSPSGGFDCSGLVQHVFADLGVTVPRTAAEQSQIGTPVSNIQQAQPGDLLFYGSPADHVGIYIGNGLMVNAPHSGQAVSIAQVGTPTSIRRVSASPSVSSGSAPANVPSWMATAFSSATQAYGLPQGLLQAVAQTESGFNPAATSSAGAVGLMQIMPSTAAGMGVNPSDPVQSIYGAASLLANKIKAFGSVPLALAAYNAGDQAVKQYGGIPPYPETINYVNTVMSRMGVNN